MSGKKVSIKLLLLLQAPTDARNNHSIKLGIGIDKKRNNKRSLTNKIGIHSIDNVTCYNLY